MQTAIHPMADRKNSFGRGKKDENTGTLAQACHGPAPGRPGSGREASTMGEAVSDGNGEACSWSA